MTAPAAAGVTVTGAAAGPVPLVEVTEGTVHPRRWTILAFALTGQALIAASVATVNVALPSIRADLHATPAQVQWVIVLYQLSYAVLLITGGRLGDMFGRRRLFLLGIVGFVSSSALAGAAPNISVLVAARLVQGLSGGLASPQILALIQLIFPIAERSRAIARFAMTSGASFMVGQLMTGGLLKIDLFGLGWRAAFLVNVPPGVVAFVGACLLFPNPRRTRDQRLDTKGAALVSAAMLMLLYPLIQGRSRGWPPVFFVVLAASAPMFWWFAVHERRLTSTTGSPLIDVRLFEARSFRLGLLLAAVTQVTFFPAFLFITITLQSGFGYDPLKTALTLTPTPVALVIGAFAASRLVGTLGRRMFAVSAVLMGVATAALMLILVHGPRPPSALALLVPMIILGIGQGFAVPTTLIVALLDIEPGHAGAASGVFQTVQQLTAATGVAVLGIAFFGTVGSQTGPSPYIDAFVRTMLVVMGFYVTLFLVHFVLPRRFAPVDRTPTPAEA